VALAALVAGLTLSPRAVPPAAAATISVTTTEDELNEDGDCALREAVRAANQRTAVDACRREGGGEADTEVDEILIPAGIYTLTIAGAGEDGAGSGDLDLTRDMVVSGAGAGSTTIDGSALDRVFHVDPAGTGTIGVTIRGLTIQNGATVPISFVNPGGGGVRLGVAQTLGAPVPSGGLTLADCVVRGHSTTGFGAGIANNAGTLTLLRTTVSGNTGAQLGGGIHNGDFGTLTLVDSTVSENTAGDGGGIYSGAFDTTLGGTRVTVVNSTISGNIAGGGGGGIARNRGVLAMTNSTLSGNRAGYGGGIWSSAYDTGPNSLNNCTVAGNDTRGAPGAGISSDGPLAVSNTIIAGNVGADCAGGLTSGGHNLIQAPACTIGGDAAGNIIGVDAGLEMLADHGGSTPTHALRPDSPAINAGRPARPGASALTCAATDQRGFLRPRGSACDIGAFEAAGGFAVSGARPNRAGNGGPATAVVFGDGFDDAATVRLVRAGEADIVARLVAGGGDSVLGATFDLAGRAPGAWDVVVTNPDDNSAVLPAGFTIEAPRAPQLFAQVIGRSAVRRGLAERYFVVFGNRGNVDAHGVPLTLSVPGDEILQLEIDIAPPPLHPEQPPTVWTRVPIEVDADGAGEGADINIPLVLASIPAGYTGALHFLLITPLSAPDSDTAEITVGIDVPGLTSEAVAALAAAAHAYGTEALGAAIPAEVIPDIERYLTDQVAAVRNQGQRTWVDSVGTDPGVFSLAQLVIDAAQFGVARAAAAAAATAAPAPHGLGWRGSLRDLLASLLRPASAEAECLQCGGGDGTACVLCRAGTFCKPNGDPSCPRRPPPGSPTPRPTPRKPRCPPPLVPHFGRCVPRKCLKQPILPGAATPSDPECDKVPRRRRRSSDPNDKSGRQGVSAAQFVPAGVPFAYVIHFENEATATAPAREVVITDQLDLTAFDLDTVALGAMSFGAATTSAPAGSTTFRGGIDLRPEQNLLVRLDAALDRATGRVTWRFDALDATTLALPDDPLAGFLPPNVRPPDGEGSVQLTVQARPGLSTGTRICNQASIVFDANEAIETAAFCNTVDASPPRSGVLPLPPTQLDPEVRLQWSGDDEGAGIASYTIYLSTDGGPFAPLLTDTTDTAATFPGRLGERYAFCAIATDLVGNVEPKACPPAGDTSVVIGPPPTPTPPPPCPGDCNGSGTVTVDELVRGVNITLGHAALASCPPFDRGGDGAVTVDELVAAVVAALSGCGA
jgi:CSLREA domain-containing protein